jgi:hypothetical protein
MVKKDTFAPTATFNQENGISTDTFIWINLSAFDERSGVANGILEVRINGAPTWQFVANTTTNYIYDAGQGSDGNSYEFRYRVLDVANNTSGYYTDGSVTVQTTGTISGWVWNDSADSDCVFDAGESPFSGVRVYISGDTAETTTVADGSYALTSVPEGTYTVCVDNTGWTSTCAGHTGLCQSGVVVTAGVTTPNINFGLKQVAAWYRGGINGDVHTDGRIYSIPVPSGEYFVTGSGIVSAVSGISISPGGVAESNWVIVNYSTIGWPTSLVNGLTSADTDVSGTVRLKVYDADLTISKTHPDWSTYFNSSSPTIIVAPNITIAGDVGDDPPGNTNKVNAILIAKNTLTVDDAVGNKVFNLKGAIFARTVDVNRELTNNNFPAMRVEFDPIYFVNTVPYFTQATHTWSEVR